MAGYSLIQCILATFVLFASTSPNHLGATGFTASPTYTVSPRSHLGPLSSVNGSPVKEKEQVEVNGALPPTSVIEESTTSSSSSSSSSSSPIQTETIKADDDEYDAATFDIVSARAARCLYDSEVKRDSRVSEEPTPSTATNWINDASAYALQKALDKLKIKLPEERTSIDRDESSSWMRWMKSAPTPLIVDLSASTREIANQTISDASIDLIDLTREDFLSRLGCRLILFPSGSSLSTPLLEPPASMIYGKLLYGGITRCRLLSSSNNSKRPPRKAGERTDIKMSPSDNIPAWIQYGGTERMYEAVDIGPAAILEFIILPKSVITRGLTLADIAAPGSAGNDMVVQNLAWKPQQIFDILPDSNSTSGAQSAIDSMDFVTGYTPISQSGKDRNDAFESDFKTSVGGLGNQIDAIVRRVLDGRVIRPADEDSNNQDSSDDTATALTTAAMEAEELSVLGLTPVRGLLLYGPPGTGKTLLARQIAKALRARAPKIVSAPELLDRWVGGSEKLVRGLFAEAEAELAACNGDATRSALHVVVIDEIDAVFRRRSGGEDSGEATRASVVNQILAKMDGVNVVNNVLIIGLTNRRELLDSALLRPGRLEVQIEVPLPDREGRREILQIHFGALRNRGRLSMPLCAAIDGVANRKSTMEGSAVKSESSDSEEIGGRKRDKFMDAIKSVWYEASSAVRPSYDLAADSATGGFSGADIAGLVRCAGSLALSRARRDGNGVEGLLITLEDVKLALGEVKP
ncbi:unnamed protein product [Cylindrotheca closterium]|uniref:Vesicle-fusing ATPase n=1 Tax=Cylindrotheca closterium TaxID=2856 RepID=A0AAD2FHL9_9STRA|nr:unnamed protein product [Cylindrotheca closterium]